MGAKSSHMITRETAMAIVHYLLAVMPDYKLANVLESALGSDYHNFYIVSKDKIEENKEQEYPNPYVETITDLPI